MEWNAYFDWYREASLETIRAKNTASTLSLTLSLPLLLPYIIFYLNYLTRCFLFFFFQIFLLMLLPFSQGRRGKKSEGNYSSLKEKLITRRSELSFLFTYTPRTGAEFKALAKEFSNPSQDTLEFAKEFRLTIWSYESGFSDPYQSIQLLASKSKARE